jgi:hypothetical protein
MLDTLTDLGRDASASQLSIDLSLGAVTQNPSPSSAPSPPLPSAVPQREDSSAMVFQRADSWPFAPPGFQLQEVHHQELMARAVVQRLPRLHKDYAIVSISPLPENALHFPAVHEVVYEFLEEHMNVRIRTFRNHIWGRL